MKKLIISVGALLLMSSTSNTSYPSDQLCMSMLNLDELNDFIWKDFQDGKLTEEQVEMYSELLQETYIFIEDYYQHLPDGTYYEFDLQTEHNY
jgi:glycyl-tRNA synthetase alpha subunit